MEDKLKSAREMFEELGYIQSVNDDKEIVYNYNFEDFSIYSYICFNKSDEKIEMENNIIAGCDITIRKLQAINKQIEELGWDK